MRTPSKRLVLGVAGAVALFAARLAMAHPGSAIVVDRLGQIWFLDTGDGLWKIDTHGVLIRVGGDWMTLDQGNRFNRATLPRDIKRVGANPTLLIASDFPIATGRDGNLYYPSMARNGRVQIMRALPSGMTTVVATLPATTASGDSLKWLNGFTGGADGHLYFTENRSIRRVTMQGQVETVVKDLRVPGCVAIPGNAASEGPFLRGVERRCARRDLRGGQRLRQRAQNHARRPRYKVYTYPRTVLHAGRRTTSQYVPERRLFHEGSTTSTQAPRTRRSALRADPIDRTVRRPRTL